MDLFRRIGTQKKKFKVQFFIGRLKFSNYLAGKVYIIIKRGNPQYLTIGDHKVKSQQKVQMTKDMKLNFNKQIMQLEVTLFFDEKENKFQQKMGQLRVILLDASNDKVLLGLVNFDLAQYANSGQQSVKEKKKLQQPPKKMEGIIQYNVFVKCIGQGSQSSLDKVSDFFFGKTKQQNDSIANSRVNETQIKDKKDKKPKNTQNSDGQDSLFKKNRKKQNQRQQKPKIQKEKVKQKEQKKINTKSEIKNKKNKLKDKTDSQDEDQQNQPIKKNYVTQNMNQNSFLTSDPEQSSNSKKKFYFDEPLTDHQGKIPKKASKKSSSLQKSKDIIKQKKFTQMKLAPQKSGSQASDQQNQNKLFQNLKKSQKTRKQEVQPTKLSDSTKKISSSTKPSQQSLYESKKSQNKMEQKNQRLQASKKAQMNNETKKLQEQKIRVSSIAMNNSSKNENQQNLIQRLKNEIQDWKSKYINAQNQIKKNQKQYSKQTKINQQLQQQIDYLQSQIKQKQDELLKQRQTINSKVSTNIGGTSQALQKQLKRQQKQKSQCLVQISRLKQKYKNDFKKYQQILSQRQQKQAQTSQTTRAQIQRLKQEASSLRQKIDKLTKQKDQKNIQANKYKNQKKTVQDQLTDMKTALSRLKMRIGSMLNDALAKGQDNIIQMLTDLVDQ